MTQEEDPRTSVGRSDPEIRSAEPGRNAINTTSPVLVSAMGRVFVLVGVAIVVFLASTAYSEHKQIQGSSEILAVKNRYFPILERLDANLVRVDKVQEIYAQVVGTGDRELLRKADEICAAAVDAFDQIDALDAGRATEIARLVLDLKQYEDLATRISLALLVSPDTDIGDMSSRMSKALTDLQTRLAAQRESTYARFVDTLAASQRDAAIILYTNLALGLMNLGFMAVLVYLIRNNAKMMAVIAEQNATLELRVAERTSQLSQKTNDINAMLQNMKLGVATIIPGCRIHREHSNYLRTIFGVENFGGRGLTETILVNSDLGMDVKNETIAALAAILGADAKVFDSYNHLLVREMRLRQSDGSSKIVQIDWSVIVDDRGLVDKVLLITVDVTSQRQLEDELSQARKLESIGQLSAGIAHEINTPTQFIGNNVEFVRDSLTEILEVVTAMSTAAKHSDDSTPLRAQWEASLATIDLEYLRVEVPRAIEQSMGGIERIKKIVGAMKDFSHPATEKTLMDLNRAIDGTVIVASNEWKYVADVEVDLDANLPEVPVMPGGFNQVILNILVNAAHAIEDAAHRDPAIKGVITISTRRVGDWAEVRIRDTGGGIPENIRSKIFDPFFTTKPVGKGTGQGLAIAHDVIVKKHSGMLTVDSEPGVGSTFIIRLPLEARVLGEAAA